MAELRSAIFASFIVFTGWASSSQAEVKEMLDQIDCKQPLRGAALALESFLPALLDNPALRLAHINLRQAMHVQTDSKAERRINAFMDTAGNARMFGAPYSGTARIALATYAGIDITARLFSARACDALPDPETTGSIATGIGGFVHAGAALASVAGEAAQSYAAAASAVVRDATFRASPFARALTLRGRAAPIQWALMDIPDVPSTTPRRSGPNGGNSSGSGPTRGGVIPAPGPIAGAGLPMVLAFTIAMVRGRRRHPSGA
jgi:hypothetical protein